MKIAIHQPEHFPYLGFFQKMQAVDLFVILDDVKFKKNNFQNRNRFINRSGNEEWFTVPVEKHCNSKNINEVLTSQDHSWKKKIAKQIYFNLKHDVSEIYDEKSMLIDINMSSIHWCMNKLNIKKEIVRSSDLTSKKAQKTQLLVDICKELKATTYVSGLGAKEYLEAELFSQENINLEFFEPNLPNYMSTICNIDP
jgi:hypothetical protein